MGPNLFAELIKRGEVHDATAKTASPQQSRSYMQKTYPMAKATDVYATGHDSAPEVSALGSISGAEEQDKHDAVLDEVVSEDTFTRKVRELVTTNGGTLPAPKVTKRALDEDTLEQMHAAERLSKNAGFLNRLVAKTNLRRAKEGKPPIGSPSRVTHTEWHYGSQSGSVSGQTSGDGSASGDVSKAVDRNTVIKALAGHIGARLRLMRRGGDA